MLVQVAAFLQDILVCICTNCVIPFSHVPSLQMAMFTTKYSDAPMEEIASLLKKKQCKGPATRARHSAKSTKRFASQVTAQARHAQLFFFAANCNMIGQVYLLFSFNFFSLFFSFLVSFSII